MALGPFVTYVPPGVYTRTLTEANVASLVSGLRIPVYIGVGQEELEQLDLELVRGSSATLDQQINNEDVSQRFVLDETNPSNPTLGPTGGTVAKFQVRNFPIVDGQGFGRTTNDVRSVLVTVDGVAVGVGSVQGALGMVTLQVPPAAGADVRCTYFFHRGDTSFTDDVSDQVTQETATLTTPAVADFVFVLGTTDEFILTIDGTGVEITITEGTYTATGLKSHIDSKAISGLVIYVEADAEGNDHLKFEAAQSLVIGAGNANGVLGFSPGAQTNRNRNFRVFQRPVVDGTDGGITTTDTTKVVAVVNGTQVVVEALDGVNGVVTLPFAPPRNSTVFVQYWANTWQDTFDYLPNTLVTTVIRSGFATGRNDYIQGQDFVISNPSPDVSVIHWGASVQVSSILRTPGAEVFDDTQILPTLVDDRLYLTECTRVVDTTVVPAVPSTKQFLLPQVPTTGNGRDTPLGQTLYNTVSNSRIGLNTNRPDLVVAYAGRDVKDATSRNALTVVEVNADTRQVTFRETVPPDHNVYATFWYSRLADDQFTMTNKVAGAVGTGQFEVFSGSQNRNLHQIRFGTKTGLPEIVQWPRGVEGIPDAHHTGAGTPVSEEVTVTFGSALAQNAVFTTTGAGPWSFFAGTSDQFRVTVNGTDFDVDLDVAVPGQLISDKIAVDGSDQITIVSGDILELTIDGIDITVDLSALAGTPTITAVVAAINAAIDADAAFIGTAPNDLVGFVRLGPAGSDHVITIASLEVPVALPDGFDNTSAVSIRQGTAEAKLGFTAFQSASGTPTATNKPATVLGTEAGTFNITLNATDTLEIRVDGIDYTVTLPHGAAVTPASVVGAINATPGLTGVASSNSSGPNADKIRLTSPTNGATSRIGILGGTANEILGFIQGDEAGQTLVDIEEVVNEILAFTGFVAEGIAYIAEIDGAEYLTIESATVGATTSNVSFRTGTSSAFNSTTGTGIIANTSGDNGEDAYDNFVVTSNNANGSSGTGVPGQTYVDATTGLTFTVLPSVTGSYTSTGAFTLIVSETWTVSPAVPSYSVGGLELIVTDTVGVGVNDSARLQTFNPGGQEPAVGDFYYVSYRYLKQDFSTRLFAQFKTIEANYGPLTGENRVTLAGYLAILNGAVLVGIKQVQKVVNTNQASDQDFITAIGELATPLPGNIRPDVMVPLTTSPAVFQYLMQHCEVQSGIRYQSERMGFIGFASGTIPTTAQAVARGLLSNRIVASYPDGGVITLTNELNESYDQLVDGTFLAAALSGSAVSPAVDVATPYTRRIIQGFSSLQRILDPVESNQTAVAGITLFEDLDPVIRVRQGLTTDMSSVLTRLPTITQIADYVQQQSRATLDVFVGTKFLSSRINEVETSMASLMRQLIQEEIVAAFTGISAEIDAEDPTIMRVEAFYQPIFPLLYIVITFNLRARI